MDFPSNVGEAMSSPVITITSISTVKDSAIIMADKAIGSIIVVENGIAVGIVTKSDIIKRVVSKALDPSIIKIKDVMTQNVNTINKDAGLLFAMRRLRELKISQLLVMDGNNMVGIISERDLIRAVSYASLAAFSPLTKD